MIEDWNILHRIIDTESGNDGKHWLGPLPDFHEETFPFIVSSGRISHLEKTVNVSIGYWIGPKTDVRQLNSSLPQAYKAVAHFKRILEQY